MAIHFFQEDIHFNLTEKLKTKKWLKQLALEEGYTIGDLNYIFCSDEYLYDININYLDHNTYTDIITFDNSDEDHLLEGDVFISIERIEENARTQNQDFSDELLRVLSHGLYHLCGYKDKLEREITIMRSKEENAILKFKSFN